MKLMISAAVRMPPTELLLIFSLPDKSLVSTSLSSRSADGWMPSSVAMRSNTSLRSRSESCPRISLAWSRSRWTRMVAMICGCSPLDQFRHRLRIHPLEAFDAAGVAALQNTADVVCRLVVAQRSFKHCAGVVFRIEHPEERFCSRTRPQKSLSTLSTCSRLRFFSFAIAAPSFCTSQRVEMLQHLHRLAPRPATAARWRFCCMPSSFMASHPLLDHIGHQLRVISCQLAGQRAGSARVWKVAALVSAQTGCRFDPRPRVRPASVSDGA